MEKKLKLNTVLLIIIIILLVVGLGYYFLNNSKDKKENNLLNNLELYNPSQLLDDSTQDSQEDISPKNVLNKNFITYRDQQYGFSLSYDKLKSFSGDKPFSVDAYGVKPVYVCIKNGANYSGNQAELKQMGFSDMSVCEYKQYGMGNTMPTVDSTSEEAINHKLKPFGSNPTVQSLVLSGQPAKIVSGNSQTTIFVKLPKPIVQNDGNTWYILTIYTTPPFVEDIISTFKFGI